MYLTYYDVIFRNYRDCWYLYTLNPFDKIVSGRLDEEPDQTIEILMTELDPSIMDIFTREKCANGREATKVSWLYNYIYHVLVLHEICRKKDEDSIHQFHY